MSKKLKCAAAGALAGAINGLFGTGGGMLLAPLFIRWVGLEERRAFATSLAVILPLCAASAAVYLAGSAFDVRQALPYLIGGLLGGLIGGRTFTRVPASLLRRVFGLLLIYGGIRNLL